MKKVKEKSKLFECGVCHLHYLEKGLRDQCEEWCNDRRNVHMEVTRHAIEHNE